MKASEFLSGLFKSKRITIKNMLVANVAEENNSLSLYCKFSKANGGVFFEKASHTK